MGGTVADAGSAEDTSSASPDLEGAKAQPKAPLPSAMKALFIVGAGRSGSTILGNVLGEIDGVCHAGELNDLWSLLAKGRYCGCERLLSDCDFWAEVLAAVRGGGHLPAGDPVAISSWHRRTLRYRRLPSLLLQPSADAERYAQVSGDLYRAIARVSGARIVVDSSKGAPGAALLRLIPGIEAYFVHLVRDPRGVAYSWERTKAPPRGATARDMRRWTPGRVARNWLAVQLMVEVSRARIGGRWLTLRYEDLAEQPRAMLERTLEFIGEQPTALPFVDDATVVLGNNHTVGGNRNRFKRGEVRFRIDQDWVSHQSRRNRLLITSMTAPLLWRYGYSCSVGGTRAGSSTS